MYTFANLDTLYSPIGVHINSIHSIFNHICCECGLYCVFKHLLTMDPKLHRARHSHTPGPSAGGNEGSSMQNIIKGTALAALATLAMAGSANAAHFIGN